MAVQLLESPNVDLEVGHVAVRLEQEFAGIVAADTVRMVVRASSDRFRDARLRQFVPVLVERDARGLLRAIGRDVIDLTGHGG